MLAIKEGIDRFVSVAPDGRVSSSDSWVPPGRISY